jgi:hypothetical protein
MFALTNAVSTTCEVLGYTKMVRKERRIRVGAWSGGLKKYFKIIR